MSNFLEITLDILDGRAHNKSMELHDGMTGSAFLAYTRRLARQNHLDARPLTDREKQQIDFAVKVFSPENFYMDGELFA